jgi:class 3 adenylate cyclase
VTALLAYVGDREGGQRAACGKNLTDVPECPEYLLGGDRRSFGVSMTDRVTCLACGEANRARARFCDRCGAELQQAPEPLPSGNRTVTLLHIDLLRSTSLGERLSPEAMPRVIQAYYAVVDKAVLEQGGRSRTTWATGSWPCSAGRSLAWTTPSGRCGRP